MTLQDTTKKQRFTFLIFPRLKPFSLSSDLVLDGLPPFTGFSKAASNSAILLIRIAGVMKSGITFCQKSGSSMSSEAPPASDENLLLVTERPDLFNQDAVLAPSTTRVLVLLASMFSMSSATNLKHSTHRRIRTLIDVASTLHARLTHCRSRRFHLRAMRTHRA